MNDTIDTDDDQDDQDDQDDPGYTANFKALTADDIFQVSKLRDANTPAQEWLAHPDREVDEVLQRIAADWDALFTGAPREVSTSDLYAAQDKVIYGGSGADIASYARFSPGGGNDQLQNAVIQSGDGEAIYCYAEHVAGADQELLLEGIIRSGSLPMMRKYAVNLPGHKLTPLADRPRVRAPIQAAVIASGNAYAMRSYANNVPGADGDSLQAAVIALGLVCDMRSYKRFVKSADKELLQEEIDRLERAV